MKHLFKILFFVILFSQSVFAASCEIDQIEMRIQIAKYGAIFTPGCPKNSQWFGINRVSDASTTDLTKCSAVCFYTAGEGSQGKECRWEKGNWGNTLGCS